MTNVQPEIRCNNVSHLHTAWDAEAAFNAGSYRIEFDLTFEHGVPLSIAKARATWVVQCLQGSYVGTDKDSRQSGLRGIAIYDPEDPARIWEVAIMLEAHPLLVVEHDVANFQFGVMISQAAASDPGAKHDKSTLAQCERLLAGDAVASPKHRQANALHMPGKKAWQILWGALQ